MTSAQGGQAGRFAGWCRILITALLLFGLSGCKRTSERDFVGKWESSRSVTPIHLAANGEWEIRKEDGTVLQYGIWRYEDKKLIWSFKQGERVMDDPTVVLSVEAGKFSIRERNGATTQFTRLPQ